MEAKNSILSFWDEDIYLKDKLVPVKENFLKDEGKINFLAIYNIEDITYEEKAPRKEALENVINSINLPGVNVVYIIKGDNRGIKFYFGVARDFSEKKSPLEIAEIGNTILKPSIQGNFRGSKVKTLNPDERKELLNNIDKMQKSKIIEGVPGINEDEKNLQGIDKIVDVMLGDEFAIMIIAKPLSIEEIVGMEENVYNLYSKLDFISKSTIQSSFGETINKSQSNTKGNSQSVTETYTDNRSESSSESSSTQEGKNTTKSKSNTVSNSESKNSSNSESSGKSYGTTKTTGQSTGNSNSSKSGSESRSNTDNKTESKSKGSSYSESKGKTEGESSSESKSYTKGKSISTSISKGRSDGHSKSENTSTTESHQEGQNTSNALTTEYKNKKIQEILKYIDDIILPRIDYGKGKGLFITSTVILGNNEASLIKLENVMKLIYSGESGNKIPVKAFKLNKCEESYVKRMQIPSENIKSNYEKFELSTNILKYHMANMENKILLGNWMSARELSQLAGLPQKEVVGLSLREEVAFGLNQKQDYEDSILLGHLVQNGIVLNGENSTAKIEVEYPKSYFDKHIFVTGVTGSGKTTTCQKLLLESKENFMVIEPAKTEYRVLRDKFPDMIVFTLSKEESAPFRLNPFEFFPGESISSRVDMLKAAMEAAFEMEAAIPQILETAMYKCYEEKGWDISSNKNKYYDNPYEKGIPSFPTLGQLSDIVEKIVSEQGFDSRLKNDYIGSIKARLNGLLVGAKGYMLNCARSINFVNLLDKKVVIELENIRSSSEKSLIMGFILSNLSEAVKYKYNKEHRKVNHITLVEEAHRLLSKYIPGDSMNKKQGVEMFSDMIAEVRKYGQSLIIADQIPNKLTEEVLKNTNTKIVHRIFAQDDKDAIGNTMALKDEQKEHLSYLETGFAVMMNPGLSKAIQLKIMQTEDNDTDRLPPSDKSLRENCIKYYCENTDIFLGVNSQSNAPTKENIDVYFKYFCNENFLNKYIESIRNQEISLEFSESLNEIITATGPEIIENILLEVYKRNENYSKYKENINNAIKDFIKKFMKNKNGFCFYDLEDKDAIEMYG